MSNEVRAPSPGAGHLARTGWHRRARVVQSPNRDARPPGAAIELLVIHNISLPPGRFGGAAIEALFTNTLDADAHAYFREIAHLKVSAHFLVRRGGELVQFVSCAERAWHAGVSRWRGRERCNDFSIGVELEGTDTRRYTVRQYARLAALVRLLRAAFPEIAGVVGHDQIAPGRKTDPGPAFDWGRLSRAAALPAHLRLR